MNIPMVSSKSSARPSKRQALWDLPGQPKTKMGRFPKTASASPKRPPKRKSDDTLGGALKRANIIATPNRKYKRELDSINPRSTKRRHRRLAVEKCSGKLLEQDFENLCEEQDLNLTLRKKPEVAPPVRAPNSLPFAATNTSTQTVPVSSLKKPFEQVNKEELQNVSIKKPLFEPLSEFERQCTSNVPNRPGAIYDFFAYNGLPKAEYLARKRADSSYATISCTRTEAPMDSTTLSKPVEEIQGKSTYEPLNEPLNAPFEESTVLVRRRKSGKKVQFDDKAIETFEFRPDLPSNPADSGGLGVARCHTSFGTTVNTSCSIPHGKRKQDNDKVDLRPVQRLCLRQVYGGTKISTDLPTNNIINKNESNDGSLYAAMDRVVECKPDEIVEEITVDTVSNATNNTFNDTTNDHITNSNRGNEWHCGTDAVVIEEGEADTDDSGSIDFDNECFNDDSSNNTNYSNENIKNNDFSNQDSNSKKNKKKRNHKKKRMLKELESSLDGTYWKYDDSTGRMAKNSHGWKRQKSG